MDLVRSQKKHNSFYVANSVLMKSQRKAVKNDRLCGLVVTVPGCRPRGPGLDSRDYQIFCVAAGLEWSPLSLVTINEELLQRKSSGSGLENRD
jgi:hypothetical protein